MPGRVPFHTMKRITPESFLSEKKRGKTVLFDVRTPKEFAEGHILSAINLPLFTDEERAIIGTTYKQRGKQAAVLQGLGFSGPRMETLVRLALRHSQGKAVHIYCWRGGMRSSSVGWLLAQAGMETHVITGGYKAIRKSMQRYIESIAWKFILLGGRTGSGKTHILHRLRKEGEQVIDLEGLANHKGSAFGWIGESKQPTSAHYFNMLYEALSTMDHRRPVWLEAESSNIGKVRIPEVFWAKMSEAPRIDIRVPDKTRLEHLVEDYGAYPPEDLVKAFESIQKRLGGMDYRQALEYLRQGALTEAAAIALRYYDKTYEFSKNRASNPSLGTFSYEEGWKTLDISKLIQQVHTHYYG